MNYLVDTHYLIWSLVDPERISAPHRAVLEDETHTKYVSSVSFWEIGLKFGLGKLKLSGIVPEQLVTGTMDAGFALLAATTEQMASSYRLEYVGTHKDPFDRLLIWQCLQQEFIFLTADSQIWEYKSVGLLLA
jgi:PIN domain nuclease of toxin-antitoxin system